MRRVVVFMKNIGRTLIFLLWRVCGNGTAFLIVHIASYFEFVGLVVKTQLFTSETFLFFKSLQTTSEAFQSRKQVFFFN